MTTATAENRSARKAKGEGHLRRAEILEAAGRVFIEYGYEGATIRRIADEVGVSSTALYMHFHDKSEIVLEICAGQIARLIEVNTALRERDMDPVQRVRDMLAAYMAFARDHAGAYRLVFCAPPHRMGRGPQEKLAELGRQTYDLFRGAVAECQAAGRLRPLDLELATQTSWATAHGVVSLTLVLTKPKFHWAPRPALDAAALDLVFDGLLAPA
ncbi:MAG: TetR/AcrR family transcriptional regulator [Caulobacteraceae bacterium]|nr:TetR/AcrR family transcriptional regulator [Caulobacter sp.]